MRICIINTGGTISCTGQPLVPMPSDRFAAAVRDLLGPAMGPPLLPAVVHPARAGLGVRLVADRKTGSPKVTERSQRRRSAAHDRVPGLRGRC